MESPLKHLRLVLVLAYFVGASPMRVVDKDGAVIDVSIVVGIGILITVQVAYIAPYVAFTSFLPGNASMATMYDMAAKKLRMGNTELAMHSLMSGVGLITVDLAVILYMAHRNKLQRLFGMFAEIDVNVDRSKVCHIRKRVILTQAFRYALVITGCVFATWNTLDVLDSMRPLSASETGFFGVTIFIVLLVFNYPLTLAATESLFQFSVEYVAEAFDRWGCGIKGSFCYCGRPYAPETSWASSDDHLHSALSTGMQLMDLVSAMSAGFGHFVIDSFAFCVASTVVCCFFVVTLASSFEMNHVRVCQSVTVATLVTLSVSRILTFVMAGQRLEDAVRRAIRSLEDAADENFERISERQRFRLQVLRCRMDRLGRMDAKAYFVLNKTALVSFVATVATYIVVLAQFKLSETSSRSDTKYPYNFMLQS